MAHKEITVWVEQVSKPLEQLALGGLIEVNHHIPTEDDVKGPAHGPGVYKVELTERDELLQGWYNTHQTSVRPLSLTEPALQVFWCEPLQPLSAIDTAPGCGQDVRVDIRGQNLYVPPLGIREDGLAHHGHGIGLFPSRAACRP